MDGRSIEYQNDAAGPKPPELREAAEALGNAITDWRDRFLVTGPVAGHAYFSMTPSQGGDVVYVAFGCALGLKVNPGPWHPAALARKLQEVLDMIQRGASG